MGDRRRNRTRHTVACRSHQSISRLQQKGLVKQLLRDRRDRNREDAQSKLSFALDRSLVALRHDASSADRVEGLIAPSEKESMPAFGFFPEQGGDSVWQAESVKRRPVTR